MEDGDLPPDDDFDAFNDETFGNDSEEYTWENSQVLFDDDPKSSSTANGSAFESPARKQHPKTFTDLEFDKIGKETDYDDFENENLLEESISRLVLDDGDDDEDSRNRKIRSLNYSNTFFLPDQVVLKQWYVDKELSQGSSILGSSVWSVPTASASVPPAQTTASSETAGRNDPNIVTISREFGLTALHHVTAPNSDLAGLLNIQSNKPDVHNKLPPGLPNKSAIKTLDEIEKELLGDVAKPPPPTQLKVGENGSGNSAKVMSLEELENMLYGVSPSSQKATPIPPSPVQKERERADHARQQSAQKPFVDFMPPHPQQLLGPHPPRLPLPPGFVYGHHPMVVLPRVGPLPHGRGPIIPHPLNAMPPPPRIPSGLTPQQQQQIQMMQMNQQIKGQLMQGGFPLHALRPLHHNAMMHPMMRMQGMRPPHHWAKFNEDPYRGLLDDRDRSRLRNIQIVQLQNDHPYTTDYYNLMHAVRNKGVDRFKSEMYLRKLFPAKTDESALRNRYQPAHFENSLGKLQAVSALAPKRAIDTVIRVSSGTMSRTGSKAYRCLLLDIEKLYEELLTIEEADIRHNILNIGDEEEEQKRKASEKKVHNALKSASKVEEMLTVPKGKMLIIRAVPLISDHDHAYDVMNFLIIKAPQWLCPSNACEGAYPYVRYMITNADLSHFTMMIYNADDASQDESLYDFLVTTQLGMTIILLLLSRAEFFYANLPDLPLQFANFWYAKVTRITGALVRKFRDLQVPFALDMTVLIHLRRMKTDEIVFSAWQQAMMKWDLIPKMRHFTGM